MVYIFKIRISGSLKPPIWRKVKVNDSLTFLELHWVIQGVFNWYNAHLFQFSPKGWGSLPRLQQRLEEDDDWDNVPYSKPNTFPFEDRYDAHKIRLKDFFEIFGRKMMYIYDFGDDWNHSIELLEVTDETILAPLCLAGKGLAPFEDCGGIRGFYDLVDKVNDKKHPEHKETREWLALDKVEKLNLNEFKLEQTQERLREVWALDKE